ncbi:hypothetical protein O6H91_08G017800 [Diphasiastrum complanatum]|nr:hypothetical protein O6H91_08G017800 [Diphasiastrum complanatum]
MLGNFLNFLSFAYAAQTLLAALGSVQFISNVAFAYLVLDEVITCRILWATMFIVLGNIFMVAFGNHQSPIYTPEELQANYKNDIYLLYCVGLVLVIIINHAIYKRGRQLILMHGEDGAGYSWQILLPFCYAIVSGAVGTHSVLFAKSLSLLLRLTLNGESQIEGWFTYLVLVLFLGTAAFWMSRLNEGLAMFHAVLIVPMLQIFWTTFSIFTGFIYFKEYQVFNKFRALMFGVGFCNLFIGILLLAPPNTSRTTKPTSPSSRTESLPFMGMSESGMTPEIEPKEIQRRRGFVQQILADAETAIGQVKSAYQMFLGLGQDKVRASSVFAMPMISSSRSSWRNPKVHVDWLATAADYEYLNVSMPNGAH